MSLVATNVEQRLSITWTNWFSAGCWPYFDDTFRTFNNKRLGRFRCNTMYFLEEDRAAQMVYCVLCTIQQWTFSLCHDKALHASVIYIVYDTPLPNPPPYALRWVTHDWSFHVTIDTIYRGCNRRGGGRCLFLSRHMRSPSPSTCITSMQIYPERTR